MTTLQHKTQPNWYGCIWYALYAVTGDENLLDHEHEGHSIIAQEILRGYGYGTEITHINNNGFKPVPESCWDDIHATCDHHGGIATRTLSIKSAYGYHDIAVQVAKNGAVWVSNSMMPEIQRLTLEEAKQKYEVFAVRNIFPLAELKELSFDFRLIPLEVFKANAHLDLMSIMEAARKETK